MMRSLGRIFFLLLCIFLPAVPAAAGDGIVQLRDGWRFHAGDIAGAESVSCNDAGWDSVAMPHTWAKDVRRKDYRGYSWYRVHIPADTISHASSGVSFVAEDMDEAWFNGVKIGSSGDPGKRIHSHDRIRIYPIPAEKIRQDNVLALRIYSAETRNRGLPKIIPVTGPMVELVRNTDHKGFVKAIFAACFLVVAGFSLVIFLRRTKGREYLWFSLFTFFIAGYTFLSGQPLRFDLMDDYNLWKKIEYLFLVPIHCFLFIFVMSMFNLIYVRVRGRRIWLAAVILLVSITAVCWLAVLFSPDLTVWDAVNKDIIQVTYVLYIPMTAGIIIYEALVKKDRDASMILVSILIFFASVLLDMASDSALIHLPRVMWYGFVFMICSIAGILSSKFVMLYGEIETMNRDLEIRVQERTQIVVRQKDELERQIGMARSIQQSILPKKIPRVDGGRFAFTYHPMMHVGGDFIDVLYDKNHGRFSIFICDVSGHGVGAAFLSSMVKMSLSAWSLSAANPAAVLASVHESLAGKFGGYFLSACVVTVDLRSGELVYASAGHPPLLLMRGGVDPCFLHTKGRVISEKLPLMIGNAPCRLDSGDRLVLYTDGIIEARNVHGDFFGEDRFVSVLKETAGFEPDKTCDTVMRRITAFSGPRGLPEDDITLAVLDYYGTANT